MLAKLDPKKNHATDPGHAKGRSAQCSRNHPLTQFAADCAIARESDTFSRDVLGSFRYLQKCPQTISLPNAIKSCPPMQNSVSSWHIAMNLLRFACMCQLEGNKYSMFLNYRYCGAMNPKVKLSDPPCSYGFSTSWIRRFREATWPIVPASQTFVTLYSDPMKSFALPRLLPVLLLVPLNCCVTTAIGRQAISGSTVPIATLKCLATVFNIHFNLLKWQQLILIALQILATKNKKHPTD